MVSEEQNSDIELASEVIPVPQVVPEVEAPEIIDKVNQSKIPHGKPRHRKNALHAAICKQMEFYFSDSNLSKDRFLGELVRKDPNVDINVFLKFNKIKSLTTDTKRIAKALYKSKILKVSPDDTKVCRITPIVEKTNIEDCTIYVQRLPSDADHEWLTTLFSKYGPVAYVSIPKFRFNQKIKGFAFVEFESPEGAKKCLKAFRLKGSELPSQTSPSEVLSITTFLEEEEQKSNELKMSENTGDNNLDASKNHEQKSEKSLEFDKPKSKKRKRSVKADDPDDPGIDRSDHMIKPKRRKDNDSEDVNISASDSNTEGEERRKKRKFKVSVEGTQDSDAEIQKTFKEGFKKQKKLKPKVDGDANGANDTNIDIKKIKDDERTVECSNLIKTPEKHKKKKRKRKNNSSYEVLNAVEMGLQIMAKKDWKRLRNKYLELQRSKMRQLKLHMKRASWNHNVDKNKMESEVEEKSTPSLEFTPGVIVKMTINEPCVNIKSFKAALKCNSSIKYIDIKEGECEAFIRCESSEAANLLVQKSVEEKSCVVLTDKEEKSYWDKIQHDREQKIKNKIRVNHRGRDKLLKKAEKELGKHIRFDEVKEE